MKWRSLEESAAIAESRSLHDVYAERKELIAKYVPAETQAIHARAVAELRAIGIAERSLKPGSSAPEFELPDQNGKPVRSTDLLQRGPLVICFIRGRWCPFCVGQIEAMNAIFPEIQGRGASLVAISPQTVHQNYLMADQHRLQFPLLSDAGNAVARQFGLSYRVPEYQQEVYRKAFVNLPFVNGDASWELPVPATYILKPRRGPDGTGQIQGEVVFAGVSPDYTDRPEPTQIVDLLNSRPAS
jgi:peroxiredoxin